MAMQTDPVCGMQVDEQKAAAKSQHQGRTYYFCSNDCKRKFDQQPQQYAAKAGQAKGGGGANP
jgi:Cu+-exporting ATPase